MELLKYVIALKVPATVHKKPATFRLGTSLTKEGNRVKVSKAASGSELVRRIQKENAALVVSLTNGWSLTSNRKCEKVNRKGNECVLCDDIRAMQRGA